MAHFPDMDGLIGAAAPCDYMPVHVREQKISKSGEPLELKLIETPDVVASAAATKQPHQWVIGFALETEDQRFRATVKMQRKFCDMMVSNAASAINSNDNSVEILGRDGSLLESIQGTKAEVARAILRAAQSELITTNATALASGSTRRADCYRSLARFEVAQFVRSGSLGRPLTPNPSPRSGARGAVRTLSPFQREPSPLFKKSSLPFSKRTSPFLEENVSPIQEENVSPFQEERAGENFSPLAPLRGEGSGVRGFRLPQQCASLRSNGATHRNSATSKLVRRVGIWVVVPVGGGFRCGSLRQTGRF